MECGGFVVQVRSTAGKQRDSLALFRHQPIRKHKEMDSILGHKTTFNDNKHHQHYQVIHSILQKENAPNIDACSSTRALNHGLSSGLSRAAACILRPQSQFVVNVNRHTPVQEEIACSCLNQS
jgi:hypothetical protein